ncbi:hypothetical protein BT93_B0961 [Corymbia citriodora subsp. variegata]|nr:hypothetical protein BT93_B0961 [Corymbia citriodora subsp. variegata]KAF8038268.1 hypothetical protein BT93_B0961 [Corymbia citriodora subsp. variegata]
MGNTRRVIKRVGSRVVQLSCESEEKVEKQRNGRELRSNSGTKFEQYQEKTTNANSSDTSRRRKRGFTCLLGIWNLPPGKRIVVQLGKNMQPIGVEGGLLGEFLGTIARNGELAPLFTTWKQITEDMTNAMIRIVESKFDYPRTPAMEKWILHSINSKWRNWKSDLKAAHYDSSQPLSYHLKNLPERVRRDQWKNLVAFWSSKEGKKLSNINKANRAKQKIRHTLGKKSFARITAEKEAELGRELNRVDLFMLSHERKKGKKPVDKAVAEAIASMNDLMEVYPELCKSGTPLNEDAVSIVLGKEKPGRIRCYGIGPCPKDFKASNSGGLPTENLRSENGKDEEIHKLKEELKASKEQLKTTNGDVQELQAQLKKMSNIVQKLSAYCGLEVDSQDLDKDDHHHNMQERSPNVILYSPSSGHEPSSKGQRPAKKKKTTTRAHG